MSILWFVVVFKLLKWVVECFIDLSGLWVNVLNESSVIDKIIVKM